MIAAPGKCVRLLAPVYAGTGLGAVFGAALLTGLATPAFSQFYVVEQPVRIVLDDGRIMRGKTSADPDARGYFVFSGAGLSCRGRYDIFTRSPTLAVTFTCTRGVSGSAAVVRSPDRQAGSGAISFSNGMSGILAFGN
jgi:hypothetical protein